MKSNAFVCAAVAGALVSLTLSAVSSAQSPGASLVPQDQGASAAKHFDPLGKPPSKFTLELRNGF